MTRGFWVWLHRWAGLAMTGFLVIVGLTGSLLAFYPELERMMNPHWYPDRAPNTWMTAGELAARLEAQEPRLRVGELSLRGFDGATSAWVRPRRDPATGQPFDLGYDVVVLDPANAAVLDRYRYGSLGGGRRIMGFVYDLHWRLALGEVGMWALGICAVIWTLDSFVGMYLTFPMRRRMQSKSVSVAAAQRKHWFSRWKPAWQVRWRASGTKLNFDLHRAGGLWLWVVLLIFGWSSVGMNLWDTVYTWTMRSVLDYQPPWVQMQALPKPLVTPRLDWRQAEIVGQQLMQAQAAQHGFTVLREVSLRYYDYSASYTYQVQTSREIDDRPRRYTTQLSFDGNSGALKYVLLPSGQHSGNTVANWLYALHMANVFGLPYRIFVSAFGLSIVMLSVTGVIIWLKKRRASRSRHHRSSGS